jgi:carbon starvation protein CstA
MVSIVVFGRSRRMASDGHGLTTMTFVLMLVLMMMTTVDDGTINGWFVLRDLGDNRIHLDRRQPRQDSQFVGHARRAKKIKIVSPWRCLVVDPR